MLKAAVLPPIPPGALLLVMLPNCSQLLVASCALCSLYDPLKAQALVLSWLAVVHTLSSSKVKPRP